MRLVTKLQAVTTIVAVVYCMQFVGACTPTVRTVVSVPAEAATARTEEQAQLWPYVEGTSCDTADSMHHHSTLVIVPVILKGGAVGSAYVCAELTDIIVIR